MPLPTPKPREDRKDFMARCMGNPTMIKEYPNGLTSYHLDTEI